MKRQLRKFQGRGLSACSCRKLAQSHHPNSGQLKRGLRSLKRTKRRCKKNFWEFPQNLIRSLPRQRNTSKSNPENPALQHLLGARSMYLSLKRICLKRITANLRGLHMKTSGKEWNCANSQAMIWKARTKRLQLYLSTTRPLRHLNSSQSTWLCRAAENLTPQ